MATTKKLMTDFKLFLFIFLYSSPKVNEDIPRRFPLIAKATHARAHNCYKIEISHNAEKASNSLERKRQEAILFGLYHTRTHTKDVKIHTNQYTVAKEFFDDHKFLS